MDWVSEEVDFQRVCEMQLYYYISLLQKEAAANRPKVSIADSVRLHSLFRKISNRHNGLFCLCRLIVFFLISSHLQFIHRALASQQYLLPLRVRWKRTNGMHSKSPIILCDVASRPKNRLLIGPQVTRKRKMTMRH